LVLIGRESWIFIKAILVTNFLIDGRRSLIWSVRLGG
jgi:hypothetical protein